MFACKRTKGVREDPASTRMYKGAHMRLPIFLGLKGGGGYFLVVCLGKIFPEKIQPENAMFLNQCLM